MAKMRAELAVISAPEDRWKLDIWNLEQMLPKEATQDRIRNLNFSGINQPWLKDIAKKYLRIRSISNSRAQLKLDLQSIVKFSKSLSMTGEYLSPSQVTRKEFLDFNDYISDYSASSKIAYISCLKLFLQKASIEGWGIEDRVYVINGDYPKVDRTAIPKAIPEDVLSRLEELRSEMPADLGRQITILLGTGMRIVELTLLKFDCLKKDAAGDFILTYTQPKMNDWHSIPVSKEVSDAVILQQKITLDWFLKRGNTTTPEYLFYGRRGKSQHWEPKPLCTSTVRANLINFAKKHKIKDSNGKDWLFHPHQFRHTFGTRLVNNGVSQTLVQKFLNHKSPEMTARYARISDQTLKEEFIRASGRLVNIYGKAVDDTGVNSNDLQWLKRNILAQALPNGYCGLPIVKGGCPHANACLSCTHFRTDETFLPEHKKQLCETKKIIDVAKANNWIRQTDVNEQIRERLEGIISSLEEPTEKNDS